MNNIYSTFLYRNVLNRILKLCSQVSNWSVENGWPSPECLTCLPSPWATSASLEWPTTSKIGANSKWRSHCLLSSFLFFRGEFIKSCLGYIQCSKWIDSARRDEQNNNVTTLVIYIYSYNTANYLLTLILFFHGAVFKKFVLSFKCFTIYGYYPPSPLPQSPYSLQRSIVEKI